MEYETTGVISSIAEDFCCVSFKLHSFSEVLQFSKFNFYMLGIRCQGHLTNILDVGQEVNISYGLTLQNRPFGVAVWIGDKPECLTIKSKPIYNNKGVIVNSNSLDIIVQSENFSVTISREFIYKNGRLMDPFESLTPGEVVSFDAVLCEDAHFSCTEYQGICGWMGLPEPRIVDRFRLNVSDEDAESEEVLEVDNVVGTVEVIPNDVIAFVAVKAQLDTGNVMLFRNSFDVECCSLREVIRVGDTLSLKLRWDLIHPHCKVWYVVRASKLSSAEPELAIKTELQDPCQGKDDSAGKEYFSCKMETSSYEDDDGSSCIIENHTFKVENSSPKKESNYYSTTEYLTCKIEKSSPDVESPPESSVEVLSLSDDEIPEVWIEEEGSEFEKVQDNGSVVPSNPAKNYKFVPFKRSWPSGNRSFLLNWFGSFRVEDDVVRVEHIFGSSSISLRDPIVLATARLRSIPKGGTILFEAVSTNCEDFCISRLWCVNLRPPRKVMLVSELLNYPKPLSLATTVWHFAKIKSLPFYDCAIATVGDSAVPVLIPLHSMVTEEKKNYCCCTMNMFLEEGVTVYLMLTKKQLKQNEGEYFQATKCWKALDSTKHSENDRDTDRILRWRHFWGSGEHLKEGYLEQSEGRYIVRPGMEVKADIFYVNGSLAKPSQLRDLVGCKFMYHVKSELQGNGVTFAWTGEPAPSPEVVLRNTFSVPEGLVDEKKYYEAVVDEFPLPDHAVCKIGMVPVLLPLNLFKGEELRELRIGTKVSVCVKEKAAGTSTYLVAKYPSLRVCYKGGAMVNFTGRIVKLPNPVGVIISRKKLKVSFEVCCVIASGTSDFEDVSSWFKYVDEVLSVGSKVRFNAIRNNSSENPYRAIEVRLDDES